MTLITQLSKLIKLIIGIISGQRNLNMFILLPYFLKSNGRIQIMIRGREEINFANFVPLLPL